MNNEEQMLSLLTRISDDLSALKEDVSGLKEDVSGLKEDVSGLKEDVSGLKEDVAQLKSAQQATNVRLDRLEAGQQTTMQRLELAEVAQKGTADRISRLEAKVETAQEEMSGQMGNLDHRSAAIAVDVRGLRKETEAFRQETADSFAGVYKCLDITDSEVLKLRERIAQ